MYKKTYIIVVGNPGDGFAYVGPFKTPGDADQYAQGHFAGEFFVDPWWIAQVAPPEKAPK